ncbi:MAG: PilZ domain-containing protein [Magnetococcales bacterium]|nr:PilZ domain-containing protein [Magnetococcales bacterium]
MQEEREQAVFASRRRHERVLFKYRAELTLNGGMVVDGITKDVSLGGVFISTVAPPEGVCIGDTGMIRLTVLNLKKELPCRVVHVKAEGIGLTLYDAGDSMNVVLRAHTSEEGDALP